MIYCDSKNTIILLDIKRIIHRHWIKYIDIRYYYIKERVENREIKLLHIFISEIIVNSLIKPLSALLFIRSIR